MLFFWVLFVAATLSLASASATTTTIWGLSPVKRQVLPSNLPNNCIYTCALLSQQLNGMCAIATSQCESVQAASGNPSSADHGCDVWSSNCNTLAAQHVATCEASTSGCVNCATASSNAYDLCEGARRACAIDYTVSAPADVAQCATANVVCNYELSLLSQVTQCGTACKAPCYALVSFSVIGSYLAAICTMQSTTAINCYNALSILGGILLAGGSACSGDTGTVYCASVTMWSRPCSYTTNVLQSGMAAAVTACQAGTTVGSSDYQVCASVYSYMSDYIQDYVASFGC